MAIDQNYLASLAIDSIAADGVDSTDKEVVGAFRLICFCLGAEEYGLHISHVQEIINIIELTPAPHTPEFISGVINLRGDIIAVIDVGRLLGMADFGERKKSIIPVGAREEKAISSESAIIILGVDDKKFGLIVDAITGIVDGDAGKIIAPPAALGGLTAEIVREVFRQDERLIMLIDIAEMIECDKLASLERG